jgi:D-glycero-alpha-D-manno-heptose-7-phosphate kinase
VIIARAPFRITLGGGGTDLPSFYEKHGGFVLSMALDKYIYVCLKPLVMSNQIRLQYSKTELVDNANALIHDRAQRALVRHGLLNGLEIVSIADLPASSGLGSSGSYLVALLTAIRSHLRLPADPATVAAEACDIEIIDLKEPVGKQDQYISAFGGIQELSIDRAGNVGVSPSQVSSYHLNELLSRLHIYYTGVSRSASEILRDQSSLKGKSEDSLLAIKDLGYRFSEALNDGEFDTFGLLLHEHWENKKKMSSKISFSKVDELYDISRKDFGVLGGKIIGAGGGGFLMLYNSAKDDVLQKYMESHGLVRLNYGVDFVGTTTTGI